MKKLILALMVALLVFASFVAAADVVIDPSSPTDSDDLYCYVDGQETVSRVFYFYKVGEEPQLEVQDTSATLNSYYTSPGDEWVCEVFDQGGSSSNPTSVGYATVTIAEDEVEPETNYEPYVTNAYIEVEAGQSAGFTVKEVSTFEYFFWYMWLNDDNVYITDIEGEDLAFELAESSELGEASKMVNINSGEITYYWNTDESMIGSYQDSLYVWDTENNPVVAEINVVITEPTEVEVDTEPSIERIADIVVYEGETIKVEVEAYDEDGDELSYSFTSLDFDWTAHDYTVIENVFSWMTEEGDSVQGEYHFAAHVEDEDGNYAYTDFKVTVLEEIEVCSLEVVADDVTVVEGDLAEADFVVYDTITGNEYSEMVYVTFTSPLDSLGQWQTSVGDVGVYMVSVTATDATNGACTDSDTFKLEVIEYVEENVAPEVEEIPDVEVDEGETATIEVIATDANGDELTYEFDFEYGSSEDNVWTWETDYNSAGKYYMTVTVSDGEYSIVQEVIVKVNNVEQEATGTGNYQGHKLYIEEVTVLNANELVSEYCFDANVETTGDYYYENGCLKSSADDSVMLVYIELLNKNSFKSRDVELTFLFAGEDYYSTYEVLDTGETGVATYRIDVPQNLETGSYTLEVLIGNEFVDAHKAINVDVVSLGDMVEYESFGFWDQIWNFFQSIF